MEEQHIALICDDAYVMPTIVTMQSIIVNYCYSKTLVFHICSFGLSEVNKSKFNKEFSDKQKIRIDIHEMDAKELKRYIGLINQKTHVTPSSLLKFELPNILENVSRVVYIDSDIIVKGNISDLFDINITEYYLAASFELWKYLNSDKRQEKPEFYFNSGVLYMNLDKMREDHISDKLWKKKKELMNDPNYKTMDQDSLNEVCKDQTLELSIRWNLNTAFINKPEVRIINWIYKENYDSRESMLNDAVVLHYVGKEEKPWKYYTANCCDLWDNFYNMTSYASVHLERLGVKKNLSWYFKVVKNVYADNGFRGVVGFLYRKTIKRLER